MSKDTFIFQGFDNALEKPIKAQDINSILLSRANPPIVGIQNYIKNNVNLNTLIM